MEENQEKKWCVYKHTNKINGKVYIGQTCKQPKKRWRNGKGYKGSKHFYNAIQKYGWDGFEHEILYDNLTLEEANNKEKECIQKYKSNDENFGYNIREGGFCILVRPETREKVSKALKNHPGYWTGKHRDEETKKKISNTSKGKKMSEEAKQNISLRKSFPVECIETGIIYYGISEAERQTGIYNNNISQCCKGTRKTAGGYHWRYCTKEEYQNYLDSKSK